MFSREKILTIVLSIIGFIMLGVAMYPTSVAAQGSGGHTDCLSCHSNPKMAGQFANGEIISLQFDEALHTDSIHEERGLGCRACHGDQGEYPHSNSLQDNCLICHSKVLTGEAADNDAEYLFEINLDNPRALSLQLNQACKHCHGTQDKEVVDSDHVLIMESGNLFAPVCMDCHGSHDVSAIDGSGSDVPEICSKCHRAVYTSYESSVHGAALYDESNPDVPTCADCHGTHVVKGPDQPNFRADSITTCGKCHADDVLMSKYGISTDVFNTYLDDFHGRTVDYSRSSRSVDVDKATCYDCHGIHTILPPENEASMVYPANLQHTCQQCHPDAVNTFPQAWLSHKVPDWSNNPILFAVTLFYKLFIPIIIGGFVVYIAIDAKRRISDRLKRSSR